MITRLGENLKTMPRIHADPKDTLELLMRPLQDNYIMTKRVSEDVADVAAKACGAPTDQEEFWKYFLQKFHQSHLYLNKDDNQSTAPVNDHKKNNKNLADTLPVGSEYVNESQDFRQQSNIFQTDLNLSRDHSVSQNNSREHSLSSPFHHASLRSLSRKSHDDSGTGEHTKSSGSYEATGSFQPNRIFNIDDLGLADGISQFRPGSLPPDNTKSSASMDNDNDNESLVYNINDLELAKSISQSYHGSPPEDPESSLSYDEDSSSYKPNRIYNIDDLELA